MNYLAFKTKMLVAKTEVIDNARELLKKAVDAGCRGESLSHLCLFIQGVDKQIDDSIEMDNRPIQIAILEAMGCSTPEP